jgi:hypothetical protein
MNIQQTGSSNSLATFMKLAEAARVRNGGFELPIEKTRTESASKAARQNGVAAISGGTYAMEKNEKPRQVLGSLFDSYA